MGSPRVSAYASASGRVRAVSGFYEVSFGGIGYECRHRAPVLRAGAGPAPQHCIRGRPQGL